MAGPGQAQLLFVKQSHLTLTALAWEPVALRSLHSRRPAAARDDSSMSAKIWFCGRPDRVGAQGRWPLGEPLAKCSRLPARGARSSVRSPPSGTVLLPGTISIRTNLPFWADLLCAKNNEDIVQVNEGGAWPRERRQGSLCWATVTG
jgi:hypothetical protein